MKLKYSIVKIDSTADDIYVKSYSQDVFEFHKSDFDGDWQNIVGEEFNLDPCTAADLSKLEMYGNEEHGVNYSLEDKLNWYTFARNKIRDDFFTNTERLAEIDTSRAIEVYNKGTISSTSELYGFFNRVPVDKMGTNPKIDLSGLKMADEFIDKDNDGVLSDGTKTFAGFANLSDLGLGSYVIKLPNIPRNLKVLNYTFNGLPHLEDISNIDFSNIIKHATSFYNLPSLKDLSSLDLSNAIEINRIFTMCQNIEHLPRLDNLNATKIEEMFVNNNTGFLIENAGDINILSEEGTVTGLFGYFKIKNIGDINIKGSVTGTLIGACPELEKIGNIELDKIHIKSNNYNNSQIIANSYQNYSAIDSILEIGDIHIKENTSTVGINVVYLPNSPVQIGDVVIDNNIGNSMGIYAINGVVGNVIVHNTDYGINTIAKEVGVVSLKGTGKAYINNNVKKIKAFPYYRTSGSYASVSSSGFDYWFDYIKTPTSSIKNIVNSTIDISRHIGTPNKNYKAIIPLSDLITVNPEYPYNFELKSYSLTLADEYSYTVGATGYTITDITKANSIKLVKIDDTTIGLDLDLEGIMDGSTLSLPTLDVSGLDVNFTADIDGVEFYGRTHLKLNGTIDFEITEDISSNFHIEYEEGEEPITEETTE